MVALDKNHVLPKASHLTQVIPAERIRTIQEDFFQQVLDFGHKRFGEIDLIGLCRFDVYHLWFPIRFLLFHQLKQVFLEYTIVAGELDKHPGAEFRIYTSESELANLFANVHVSSTSSPRPKAELGKYTIALLLRAVLGLVKNPFLRKAKRLLLYSNVDRLPSYDPEADRTVVGDPMLGGFFREIWQRDDFAVMLMLKNPGFRNRMPSLAHVLFPQEEIKRYGYFETYLLGALLNPRNWPRLIRYRTHLKKGLGKAVREAAGFDRVLLRRVEKNLNQFILSALRIMAAGRMMEHLRPACVGGDDEYAFGKRPVLQVAESLGIPTYGIQHADITPLNVNYAFLKKDAAYHPIPSKTAIWGKSTLDRITSGGVYSHDTLTVTGHPRTDVIAHLLRKPREQLLPGAVPGKLVVLYASQPLYDSVMRQRLIHDVLIMAKELPFVQLIVKPHPNEKDWEMFRNAAQVQGVNIDIRQDELYKLLAASDVVITYFSTVGLEATYFGRELVLLDYAAGDLAGYHRDGVGWMCTSAGALKNTITQIRNGEIRTDPEVRRNYIEQRVFHIDGGSSRRLVDFIAGL